MGCLGNLARGHHPDGDFPRVVITRLICFTRRKPASLISEPAMYIIYYFVIGIIYYPFPDPGEARRLPHNLLDGAFYDPRAQTQQPAASACFTSESRDQRLYCLPALHRSLPHEP